MTEPQLGDGLSSKTVTLKVTVEGEATYEITHAVLDSQIAQFNDDLFDHVIGDLIIRLRKYRKVTVYGKCSEEGCSLPRAPIPLVVGNDKCTPHDRQDFIVSPENSRHA